MILISFLFTAKRALMMSSSHSRSGPRSRSRARSRGPTRRRSPRSRVHRDLKENVMAVAVRTIAFHLRVTCCMGAEVPKASHIWVMGLLLRLQRSLTSEDRSKKRPPEIQCVSPSDTTRHAADESSDTSEYNDDS